MGDITIRKLDDDVIRGLAIRAAKRGVSREEESRRILTEAVRRSVDDVWERLASHREETRGTHQTDSAELLREIRDSR
ncbi:hypothetical protein [Iodidimonas sp. SYSU 1G8]|uniref:FitA-like ribbon-helix-helix domain-containing protein n=1 Tax=Iodidimonas sp. SYSU 1G8 TaxID=3133967 RepID=UPI0031FEC691